MSETKPTSHLIVQKFGGSSLESIPKILDLAQYVKKDIEARGGKRLIVVSAMGHETNDLLDLARTIDHNPPKRELDMLVTIGERKSMALFSIACQKFNLSTVSLTGSQAGILTNGNHTHALIQSVSGERLIDALGKYNVVVVAGFQGVDRTTKEITTLGRGGSDLTAVAMAVRLGANRVEIFKDVPGIFNSMSSPSRDRHLFKKLGWLAAYRMSLFGASVIHSRAAFLAYKNRIEIDVRCSTTPLLEGTVIGEECDMESSVVKATTVIRHGMLVRTQASRELNLKILAHLEVVHISHQYTQGDLVYWINLDNSEGREAQPDFLKDPAVLEVTENVSFLSFFGGGFFQDSRFADALASTEQNASILAVFATPEMASLACKKTSESEELQKLVRIFASS